MGVAHPITKKQRRRNLAFGDARSHRSRQVVFAALIAIGVGGCGPRSTPGWERFSVPPFAPSSDQWGRPSAWTMRGSPIYVTTPVQRLFRIDGGEIIEDPAARQAPPLQGPFRTVFGTGPADIWVDAGLHFDGEKWQGSDPGLANSTSSGSLYGARPDRYFFLTTDFFRTAVWAFDGTRWVDRTADLPPLPDRSYDESYEAIHGSRPDDVHVVGAGRAVHFDGVRWQQFVVPQRARLGSVWAFSPHEAYAAGNVATDDPAADRPIMLRYDGTAWLETPSPTSQRIFKLAACGQRLLVGTAGAVHERDEQGRWRTVWVASPGLSAAEVFCGDNVLVVVECEGDAPKPPMVAGCRYTNKEVTVWVHEWAPGA